jgi:hypothetical protein
MATSFGSHLSYRSPPGPVAPTAETPILQRKTHAAGVDVVDLFPTGTMRLRPSPSPAALFLVLLLASCDSSDGTLGPGEVEEVLDLYDMKLTPQSGTASQSMETTVWLQVTPYVSSLSVQLTLASGDSEVTLTTRQAQDAKGASQFRYSVAKISQLQDQLAGAKTLVLRWRVFDAAGVQQDLVEGTLTVVGSEH